MKNAIVCSRCRLARTRTKVVLPDGAKGGILAVGEAPGREEDRGGCGFLGMAGRNLDAAFTAQKVARSAYARTNVVRCRPPDNRKPRCDEVMACAEWLDQTIEAFRPQVLLAVGQSAAERLIVLPAGRYLDYVALTLDQAKQHGAAALPTYRSVPVVPMPHTSPLAWNRKRSDGSSIRELGEQAVRLALSFSPGTVLMREQREYQGDLFDLSWQPVS